MNNDMPWVDLTQEEIDQLRQQKQHLTEYGQQKLRERITANMDGGVGGSWKVHTMSRFEKNPDEIVLEDVKMFHYETMEEGRHVWIGIYTNDGSIYHMNIGGDNLKVYYSNETCEP